MFAGTHYVVLADMISKPTSQGGTEVDFEAVLNLRNQIERALHLCSIRDGNRHCRARMLH